MFCSSHSLPIDSNFLMVSFLSNLKHLVSLTIQFCWLNIVTLHLSENVFIPPSFFKKIQYIENTAQRHLLFLSLSRRHLVFVALFFVIVFWFPLFLIGSPAIICSIILLCNVASFSGCFQDFSFIFGFQQFDHDVPRCGVFVFILLGITEFLEYLS